MKKLTENLVQQRLKTCTTDLDKVQQINVTGRDLKDVSLLRKMTGVEVLSLSVNQISSLADFQCCKHLKELYLRHNKITNLNEIFYLKGLPKLELLMLSQNPCAEEPLYRLTVIKNLKNLRELDGVAITQEERRQAQKEGVEIKQSIGLICPSENTILDGPQIHRTPIQSVQKLNQTGGSQSDESSDSKSFKIVKKTSSLSQSAKECVKDPSTTFPPRLEKTSLKGKPQSSKLKQKNKSPPPLDKTAVSAAMCKLCGNGPPETFRIASENSNILSATLSLIKELDYGSLQIINAEVNTLLSAFEVKFMCQRQPFFHRNLGMSDVLHA